MQHVVALLKTSMLEEYILLLSRHVSIIITRLKETVRIFSGISGF